MNHFAVIRLDDSRRPATVQIVAEYQVTNVLRAHNYDAYVCPITPHWTAQILHPSTYADLDTRPTED
jgi:hypothetical protein